MPLVATRGAASAQGFGEFARVTPPIYIEDVFSTYLYTGTGSSQTITNGIDLSGKGGLVWLKSRNNPDSHYIVDTARGSNKVIYSNLTIAEETLTRFSSFNSNGFSLSTTPSNPNVNGYTYASWTFREQAKFFDVVTYTGNGAVGRAISHNLGSVPGFVIIKRTDSTSDWFTAHRSVNGQGVALNSTDGADASYYALNANNSDLTATTVTVSAARTNVNTATYVMYLFAHNAGGFGATGTDNVISCGSFTADGSGNATVNLGYEPQWLLIKSSSNIENWVVLDNMRGISYAAAGDAVLYPNLSNAEVADNKVDLTSTGFYANTFGATRTYIYIAIRRGPMKTPTSGTSVFSPVTRTGTGAIANVNCGFAPDMVGMAEYPAAIQTGQKGFTDKLRGGTQLVYSSNTTGELASGDITQFQNTGVTLRASGGDYNVLNALYINWFFQRAPGFFDIVCYTGTGSNTTQTHNLAVVPELILVKGRSASTAWQVYSSSLANTEYLVLNTTAAKATGATRWNSTTPTSSVFSLGTASEVNTSAATYMAYLFATCPGVSKVGSYTGTGATQVVNCGFAAGSRFVLIKATSTTGDWYVWDSARGIVAGNDPYLAINTTNAQVTNTDWVDTAATGFELSNAGGNLVNTNGGTYIFLAIA